MILRCYERCMALWAVWRSGERQLSTVGPTARQRAGDIQTFACTPSHFCHLRSLRGILCGFTAIISSKRLSPSVPKYNQHRVFLAQTVTEAAGLISCKITFQLCCTYCCTIERYSEKYKHGEELSWRDCNTWVFKLRFWNEGVCPVSLFLRTNKSHVFTGLHSTTLQAKCPTLWPALDGCLYTVRHLRNVTVIMIWAEQYRPQYGKLGCRHRKLHQPSATATVGITKTSQPHITAKCLTSRTVHDAWLHSTVGQAQCDRPTYM
jgi:hypothetical protein